MGIRLRLTATVVGLLLLGVFFFAPLVPYSRSFSVPGNVHSVVVPCQPGGINIVSTGTVSVTGGNYTLTCLGTEPYPPVQETGYATLAYRLLGSGPPPFPGEMVFTQGNKTGIMYFQGENPVSAEVVGPAGTEIDPPLVSIQRASFYPGLYGGENLTVVFQNVGQVGIEEPIVFVEVVGHDYNITQGGISWIIPFAVGECADYNLHPGYAVPPGGHCTVSNYVQVPYNVTLDYHVEVRGLVAGHYMFYSKGYSQYVQNLGMNPEWVRQFIDYVEQARGTSIVENATLDSFAAMRFRTASSNPGIADYGLASDAAAFFGEGGAPLGLDEELLFPGGDSPSGYAAYIQGYAPAHWAGLTSGSAGQFGYYIGQGPYFAVSPGCPVNEVPSAGTNITQYFESHGCTINPVKSTNWLVLILAS